MQVSEREKHEYWNHFMARFCTEKIGGGYGVTGKKVTGHRLGQVKKAIFADAEFWQDVILRHGGDQTTPERMMSLCPSVYEHCLGNFWGMLLQTMGERRII